MRFETADYFCPIHQKTSVALLATTSLCLSACLGLHQLHLTYSMVQTKLRKINPQCSIQQLKAAYSASLKKIVLGGTSVAKYAEAIYVVC